MGPGTGISRSLRLYYGDRERERRMVALAAMFVRQGGLAFDIGAHVGDRTAVFRRLGSRVVSVEPQPWAMRALRLIHGRDPEVRLVHAAVDTTPGRGRLLVNTGNPTVSTLSPAFVAAARDAPGWQDQRWDGALDVDLLTLDQLVGRFGLPDFVKIDVEGNEDRVLAGLRSRVAALSFEFTTLRREVATACVSAVARLGRYEFNVSLGETHRLEFPTWVNADRIEAWISQVADSANSGDIYARFGPGAGRA